MDIRESDYLHDSKNPLRVLLVDDAQLILDRLIRALQTIEGIQIIGTSETSSDAISQIGELKPDLVVLDISLRDSNGWDVLRHIVDEAAEITVYMFSNNASETARGRFILAGADRFFDKSLDFSALMTAVKALVQRHRC